VAVGGDPKKTRAAVVLDDSVAGLAHPDFRTAWRLWLQMSNLLALRTLSPVITTTSLASEKAPAALGPVDLDFSGEWAVVIEQATEQEKAFARELVDLGVPAPVIGLESDDGIPIDFAWVNARVAVALDWDDENRGELTGEGWTVFDADAVAVHAAVTGGGH
jgi:hypothetical protein